MSDFTTEPIDPATAERLRADGLGFELVDTSDRERFGSWMLATNRGFHGGALESDVLEAQLDGVAYRRTSGVYDPTALDPAEPVGTVNSWVGELTVPGERGVPAWAISSVSVASTHRRRGIARAILEAELATASRLGIPIAMLTVSESTIYGRFGFAPAAMAADWTIDTHRVHWIGPAASGRVRFVTIPEFRADVEELHERTRLASPGQIDMWGRRWDQFAGIRTEDKDRATHLRAVRHIDDGVTRGVALYRVNGGDHDFTSHKVSVEFLVSETPDAYAALWRFLLEIDLVMEVTASLRRVDEPLRWLLSDWRGATVKTYDHQWLRILDVVGAFSARSYVAPGSLALTVTDPLGYTTGTWLLTVPADGDPVVEPVETPPADTPALALTINELSSLYLGGVSATNLAEARLLTELTPGAAAAADALLRSPVTPWLSTWY